MQLLIYHVILISNRSHSCLLGLTFIWALFWTVMELAKFEGLMIWHTFQMVKVETVQCKIWIWSWQMKLNFIINQHDTRTSIFFTRQNFDKQMLGSKWLYRWTLCFWRCRMYWETAAGLFFQRWWELSIP